MQKIMPKIFVKNRDSGDAMRSSYTQCQIFFEVIKFMLPIYPCLLEFNLITYITYFEQLLCKNSKLFVHQTLHFFSFYSLNGLILGAIY